MEKENETIVLNGSSTLKDDENNETSLGNSEWDEFLDKIKHRNYETEVIKIRDLMKRLFPNKRKHIYDFLKLDFSSIKYIIPFLKNNKGLTFDYYVIQQSPIIKRMLELINYKI